jgi:ribosomal protein S21
MVIVKKKKGESEDKLITRFKRRVVNSGLLQEARDRSRFVSKAEKRKENKARKKHRIELEKKRSH